MGNLYLPILASMMIIVASIVWALRVIDRHKLLRKRTMIVWGLLVFGLFFLVALGTGTSWPNVAIGALIPTAVVWAYVLSRAWLSSRGKQ